MCRGAAEVHVLARFPRRRSTMDTARGAVSRASHVSKAPSTRTSDLAPQVSRKPLPSTTRRLRRGGVANVVVMTVAVGIVGTDTASGRRAALAVPTVGVGGCAATSTDRRATAAAARS